MSNKGSQLVGSVVKRRYERSVMQSGGLSPFSISNANNGASLCVEFSTAIVSGASMVKAGSLSRADMSLRVRGIRCSRNWRSKGT